MVGAKLTILGESRIITAFTSTTQVTVHLLQLVQVQLIVLITTIQQQSLLQQLQLVRLTVLRLPLDIAQLIPIAILLVCSSITTVMVTS
jgi:hypothetical protein